MAPASGTERPFVLGVTGNIACGKSSVLRMLAELGAETIDADEVYHNLIEPGRSLWQSLVEHFGDRNLADDGHIDRRALGAIVFADPTVLANLDRLTHPAVIEEIERIIAASAATVVAVDAVKLIESGMDTHCDRVWLVTCRPEQQIDRLTRRNGIPREDAQRRVAAQPPLAPKLERADLVLDNSATLDDTRAQVRGGWHALPINQGS